MKKNLISLVALMLLFMSCSGGSGGNGEEPKEKIEVTVTSNQVEVHNGEKVTFTATATGGNVTEVIFYVDGHSIGSSLLAPYQIQYKLEDVEPGSHKVTCVAKSEKGNDFKAEISVFLKLRLGDEYQGGKIFKLNDDGNSGLIASTSDLQYDGEVGFFWGDQILINASDDNGQENTKKMVAISPDERYAAFHFKNGYNHNGYNDWYIPAINELEILKENKRFVGGFSSESNWKANYWSSSEINQTKGEALHFNVLMGNSYNKEAYSLKVRPIRQF